LVFGDVQDVKNQWLEELGNYSKMLFILEPAPHSPPSPLFCVLKNLERIIKTDYYYTKINRNIFFYIVL
jgi:hypothetical protein